MKTTFATLGGFFSFLVIITMVSCGGKSSGDTSTQDSLPTYELLTLKAVDAEVTYRYPALLEGNMDVDIFPQAEGRITGIYYEIGAYVTKGQRLFTIESSKKQMEVNTLRASVKSAEAVVNSAKLKLDSQKKLYDKNIVSEYVYRTASNEYSTALSQLAETKAQLNIALTDLAHCTVTAPISGVVNAKNYKVGTLVSPMMAQPLTTISDQSSIIAKFSIPENLFADVITEAQLVNTPKGFRTKDGKTLDQFVDFNLLMSNGQTYSQKGQFISMSGMVDNQTGTATCYVRYDNPAMVLHSGNSATIVIPLTSKGVFVIPQSACKKLQDKYLLYKAGKDGKAESVIVDVYPTDDGKSYIVIPGKLKAGDIILASGVARMTDGTKLK